MSKRRQVVLRRARGRGAAQPGVDVAGGLLAVADADRHGPLARHHVAAREHAGAAGLERRRHLHGAVALELHSRHLAQERGVGLLAEREDHGVGGERLEPAGRLRVAGLVELHHLDLQLRAVEGRDRPQPVDPHAFPLGVLGLLEMGRHLLAGAPVDDQRLVRAQPAGDPGGVHRRVAAAVDRHAAADHRPLAGGDAAQERHRVDDPAGIPGRDVDPLGQVGADRDEDRVESRPPRARRRGPRPGARRSSARPTPRSGRARRRARRGAAGRPGCRTASSRPARRPRPGSPPRGRAGPGGRRPTARSARRRSRAPACRCGPVEGRTANPARARGRRGTARPSGSRRRCRGRRGCRRSRTGGSRPARGSRAADCRRRADATPARAGPPGCARARPGCSRRPGSRRCTAAAGRRRRAGARGPGRCGSARAAGPAAASRPASGRSCLSRQSDNHRF